ncbi:hypothetical protein [Salinilacihabitans rarus]|uniref:hypothetical protein n=1 Tax=Salinilacihabitans rarus TaxID=2961596 RepID=UPI0020C92E15|nr:hypothetical protein [Salinilacihabitans rarus]
MAGTDPDDESDSSDDHTADDRTTGRSADRGDRTNPGGDHADSGRPATDLGDGDATVDPDRRPTAVNGLLGALVSLFLLSLVSFAPLFGGLVSGYLEGDDLTAGTVAGAFAGVIAAAAVAAGLFLANGIVPGFFPESVLVGPLYVVAFATAGGATGSYLNGELGDEIGRY